MGLVKTHLVFCSPLLSDPAVNLFLLLLLLLYSTPTSSNTLTHRSTVYHVDIVLSEYAKRTQCICPHYKSLTEKPISNKFRHYVRVFGMSMTSKLDSQTSTSFPIDRIIHVYTDQRQAEVTGMVSDANNQQTICVDGPQSFNVFNCVSLGPNYYGPKFYQQDKAQQVFVFWPLLCRIEIRRDVVEPWLGHPYSRKISTANMQIHRHLMHIIHI